MSRRDSGTPEPGRARGGDKGQQDADRALAPEAAGLGGEATSRTTVAPRLPSNEVTAKIRTPAWRLTHAPMAMKTMHKSPP